MAKSKCGTFDNINHIAGGGDVEIYDEKALPWKEGSSRKGSNSMGSITLETLSSVSGSEGMAFRFFLNPRENFKSKKFQNISPNQSESQNKVFPNQSKSLCNPYSQHSSSLFPKDQPKQYLHQMKIIPTSWKLEQERKIPRNSKKALLDQKFTLSFIYSYLFLFHICIIPHWSLAIYHVFASFYRL